MRWLSRMVRRAPLLHVAGDTGTGSPVVLLHGIASSSVTWENVVPLVVERHRAISIDLLGFGRSPAPPESEYTLEEHVASLHRTVRDLRLREPFVLVGHSMGALIATRYAAVHSKEVARLVLVAPPIYFAPTELGAPVDRAGMDIYLRVYEFLRTNKEFTIRAAAGLSRLSPIKNLLDVTERNWRAFVLSLEKAIESQTTITDLVAVDAPVHLVYGSLDPFLHPAGIRIAEKLRGVIAHKVAGGDHIVRPRMARVVATAIG